MAPKKKVLLIEDDPLFARAIITSLRPHFQIYHAPNFESSLEHIENGQFDMAIIDLNLDGILRGHQLLIKLKEKNCYSVIISANENQEIIDQCYSFGADNYFTKEFLSESIDSFITTYGDHSEESSESELIKKFQTSNKEFIKNLLRIESSIIKRFPLLLLGETGVGKSTIAKMIHETGKFKGDFISLNCAAIPEQLLESELFGAEKGSFTGASKSTIGKLKLADEGVLFLDEIGNMSFNLQAKILKAIEEKSFYSVGSNKLTNSNFMLITATNENLIELSKSKNFRLDLYYRISHTILEIPPLRKRSEDIMPLLISYLPKFRKYFFCQKTIQQINEYHWPGNVRELNSFSQFLSAIKTGNISEHIFLDFLNSRANELALIS